MNEHKRLLILDGNSLLNRAFYAIPLLTTSEGIHTNAIYGFLNMLFKMKEEINPDYIVCTFDKNSNTFRHKEYEEYKQGRKKMPDELREQFPILKEILEKMDINIFEIEGFEADDLIGTLSLFSEKEGIENYIVTGDKDALQLASETTKILITKKGITEKEIYDYKRIVDEMGVTPTEFIDVKGLMGDSSDNIPGVPGIGEKTAFKLIQEYKSIENVLLNIENLSGKKIKENLTNFREQAIFSKYLATIVRNVPIDVNLEDIKSKNRYDYDGLKNLFLKLNFKSLISKLEAPENKENDIEIEVTIIDTISKFKKLINKVTTHDNLFISYELLNGNDVLKSSIDTLYLYFEKKGIKVILKNIIDTEEGLNLLIELLKTPLVVYDSKPLYHWSLKENIPINISMDLKLASYVLDPTRGENGLKDLISTYLQRIVQESDENAIFYEIMHIENLYNCFKNKISELNMNELLYEVEQPLAKVLAAMEIRGFNIDKNELNVIGENLTGEIKKLEEEIYNLSEEKFNISSPKQLGKILFEKLDLPVVKKTKTGYSTNAEVLESLLDKHPIIEKVINYRQLTKIQSTYVEGLKNVIMEDGKIHTSFNQTITTTGRLSSTEPNLQNIPIKYEIGRRIRKAFIPEKDDCIILSGDYSQIELRVLAHIANDDAMITAFKNGVDIHALTASEVHHISLDEVTHEMRSNAKAVNFGIVYGIGEFSLAKDLKISRAEAKRYIDAYFNRYPKVKEYLESIIEEGTHQGYVTTLLNRRRFIPEIKNSNKIVKALGERLAMNTPIQGSAADIIKLAMVKVYNELNRRNLKSFLILQVHDELILNVYKDELDEVKELLKECMENVIKLKVPLEVDLNEGKTWYDAK